MAPWCRWRWPLTNDERLTTRVAVCRLCRHLLRGEAMTTQQAADRIGYSRAGAWKMLCDMSAELALVQDDRGLWYLAFDDNGGAIPPPQ